MEEEEDQPSPPLLRLEKTPVRQSLSQVFFSILFYSGVFSQCCGRKWGKPGCMAGLTQLPFQSCSGGAQAKGLTDNRMQRLFWLLGDRREPSHLSRDEKWVQWLGAQTSQSTGQALGTERFAYTTPVLCPRLPWRPRCGQMVRGTPCQLPQGHRPQEGKSGDKPDS